jgi:hypothetical protein
MQISSFGNPNCCYIFTVAGFDENLKLPVDIYIKKAPSDAGKGLLKFHTMTAF